MADNYTVRLPDGNEYGPADLATVRIWHEEGRIGPDCLVWREDSRDWVPLLEALGSMTMTQTVTVTASPVETAPAKAAPAVPASEPKAEARPAPAPAARPRPRPPVRRPPPPSRAPLVVAGVIGVVLVAVAGFYALRLLRPGGEAGRVVREWSSSERRFADDAIGLSLEAPVGWSLLRPGNPLVPVEGARVTLGHAATGALAFLATETARPGVSLDAHLEAVLKSRPEWAGAKDLGHADLAGAKVPARLLRSSWTQQDERYRGLTVAWQDGWNLITLHGWCREDASGGGEALEALARAVSVKGVLTARIAQATDAVLLDAPQLSRASAELLVRDRLSRGLPTRDVPAQSLAAVRRGLSALGEAERAELTQIWASVYAAMPEKDRLRLAAYLDERRTLEARSPEEDQAMAELLKAAVLGLPEETRARLQALNEKAIAAGTPP